MILIACESAEQSQSHKQNGDGDGDLRRTQLEVEMEVALACNRNVNILMMELNEPRVDFHSVDPLKCVSSLKGGQQACRRRSRSRSLQQIA